MRAGDPTVAAALHKGQECKWFALSPLRVTPPASVGQDALARADLASDELAGGAMVVLDGAKWREIVTPTQLYSPYGALPTSYGYTHQHSDAVSGLDDYGAKRGADVGPGAGRADVIHTIAVSAPPMLMWRLCPRGQTLLQESAAQMGI